MNKNDYILVFIMLLLLSLSFLITANQTASIATVFFHDQEVLKIDLSKKMTTYEVEGELGKVVIEAGDGKVRVVTENSPKHLCSKQGFIKNSGSVIVCLPNKIVIKVSGNNQTKIDGVV